MRNRPESVWKIQEPDSRGADIQERLREIEVYSVIGRYKPSFLGEGSEHAVFELEGHPNIVAKVNIQEGAGIMKYNQEHGFPPEYIAPELKADVQERTERDENRFRLLQEYFPNSVLNERKNLVQMPMTNALAKTVFGDTTVAFDGAESYTIPMRLRIQERIPKEAQMPEATDLKFRYLEQRPIVPEVYERLHGVIDGKITGEEYFASYKEGEKIVKTLKENEKAKIAVREFVKRAITYSEETGEALDLAGPHNVILFEDQQNTWRVILPDGMYPSKDLWSDARDVAAAYKRGEELNSHDANVLMNSLNYARTINALADMVGVKDRLHLFRGATPGTGVELKDAILRARRVS